MFIVRIFKVLLLCVLLALVAFEVYSIIVFNGEGRAELPPNFGNFQRIRDSLADGRQREQFSFVVVGDTRGHGTFERILEASGSEPLSFMLLLGDCVSYGTSEWHSYFRSEWAEYGELSFPVFYVVGNHDVYSEMFSIEEFEKNYGPTNFSFEYQGCLFIVLRVISEAGPADQACKFLESQLSGRRNNYRKVFVFMHIPPLALPGLPGKHMVNSTAMVSLLDKYQVDYVIAGHYHGYSRTKRKNTVYLTSGGGGAHLKKNKFGAFHHAIMLTVGQDSVSEQILYVDRNESVEDSLECFALTRLYPWLKQNRVLAVALNALILGACFWLFRAFLKHRWLLPPT